MSATEKGGEGPSTAAAAPQAQTGPKFKAYKLLLDPFLVKGATKLYRFDGVVPDDPTYPPVTCRDPRTTLSLSRIWNRLDCLELPVPRFKVKIQWKLNGSLDFVSIFSISILCRFFISD